MREVVDACNLRVAGGVAATTIEDLDFGLVLRAREEVDPRDSDGVDARRREFLTRLDELS